MHMFQRAWSCGLGAQTPAGALSGGHSQPGVRLRTALPGEVLRSGAPLIEVPTDSLLCLVGHRLSHVHKGRFVSTTLHRHRVITKLQEVRTSRVSQVPDWWSYAGLKPFQEVTRQQSRKPISGQSKAFNLSASTDSPVFIVPVLQACHCPDLRGNPAQASSWEEGCRDSHHVAGRVISVGPDTIRAV